MTINDILALGVEKAVRELGYTVPKDISIAGYDDVIFSSISHIPLTTVRQDVHAIARQAVDLLIDKIEGENHQDSIFTLPPELIVRDSTGSITG
jgi:LacI family transcriptional regulator